MEPSKKSREIRCINLSFDTISKLELINNSQHLKKKNCLYE